MTENLKLMTVEELRRLYTPGQWINSIKNLSKEEINKFNEDGKTLLMIATKENASRTTIDALLEAGADYCLKRIKNGEESKNSLELAVAHNSERALNAFLKFSASGQTKNTIIENNDEKNLYTWDECEYLLNYPQFKLLKRIANEDKVSGQNRINEQDENGMTLLMSATRSHFAHNVEVLLSLGANPEIKNEKDGGKTALDYAREVKSASTEEVLMNWKKIQDLCSNDSL